ncbi:hypothetical protein MUN82_02465 [Hymenobacter aerilatus]|uniref:Uncharacterized protein n=1 Tax=Hymenobacter aerilatus TaxID=2932251 RepID=A0A8T9T1L1_9BACT|nr:hypothetical protein [Hymenobacter aerilatus]UOR05976.1 hypothetical protein MUN82_02465 [Hymenobacter aerilatus]
MNTPSIPSEQDEEKGRTGSSDAKNADATVADGSGDGAQQNMNSSELAKNSPEAATESTQENMGDGSGIRGDYGDSSQTNGKEG